MFKTYSVDLGFFELKKNIVPKIHHSGSQDYKEFIFLLGTVYILLVYSAIMYLQLSEAIPS